jgi:glyoxylase-like metal-dependent hydrolase (beta-lactamase superfamily II)
MGVAPIHPLLASLSSRPLTVFATHTHIDHVGGLPELAHAEILVHPLEADELHRAGVKGLRFPPRPLEQIEALRRAGIELPEYMVDAVPHENYDRDAYGRPPVRPTRLVSEGDVIETGDRTFEVLHLPGHSPGSIALWDDHTGSLFAGDVIYDGVLVDTGPGASISAYLPTMERLKRLPVREVFGGHNDPMSRARMISVIDRYMASRSGRGR